MDKLIVEDSIEIIEYISKFDQFINKIAYNVVKKCPKLEHEDVKQQLLLVLLQSNLHYDFDKNTKNSTYYSQILINSSFNIIRKYWQTKNKIYTEAVSLDAYIDEQEGKSTFMNLVSESEDSYLNPRTHVKVKEMEDYLQTLIKKFNKTEKKIFDLYSDGLSVNEISKKMKISKKSVYNALTTIKEKLKKYE